MKKLFLTLPIFCLLFIQCEKDNIGTSSTDSFFFGHFYGECGGEGCIEIFKIENGKLYEDTKDRYPNSSAPYEGDFKELGADKYDLVEDLYDSFPEELLSIDNGAIGQPDAGDWGGYYVGLKTLNEERFWLIDTQTRSIPTSLHDFNNKISEAIQLINQ